MKSARSLWVTYNREDCPSRLTGEVAAGLLLSLVDFVLYPLRLISGVWREKLGKGKKKGEREGERGRERRKERRGETEGETGGGGAIIWPLGRCKKKGFQGGGGG